MKKLVIFIINFYQKYLSILKKPCCRFYPVCSNYAKEAINRFGVIKGLGLAIYRFLRCNPLFPGGYDPVPNKKTKFE